MCSGMRRYQNLYEGAMRKNVGFKFQQAGMYCLA